MTALSYSLVIPEQPHFKFNSLGSCGAEDFMMTEQNIKELRFFLRSMVFLLQEQWEHYSNLGNNAGITLVHTVDHGVTKKRFSYGYVSLRQQNFADWAKKKFFFVGSTSVKLCCFICRLLLHANCSIECYLMALILIDRCFIALLKNPLGACRYALAVDKFPFLFAVFLMVSAKFRDERVWSNRYFSQLVGLPLAEWNALELLVVSVLGFDVRVSHSTYTLYESLVFREMALRKKAETSFSLRLSCRCSGIAQDVKKGAGKREEVVGSPARSLPEGTDFCHFCGATTSLQLLFLRSPTKSCK